ncbi:MAG: hypothetical protein P8N49_04425 [Opitutales bacterium]|nr:hypothetical protein [Opitutales bacterium]
MSLSKNERRLTIWIGIAIGVACSSLLVRYALKKKNIKAEQRLGNYSSGVTASDQVQFPSLPEKVKKDIPHGIVVFHDYNQSVSGSGIPCNSWVIESSGKFRSERLFILVEQMQEKEGKLFYYRASEIYTRLQPEKTKEQLNYFIDEKTAKIIGKNSKSQEYIIQIKHLEPSEICKKVRSFRTNQQLIASARLPFWQP